MAEPARSDPAYLEIQQSRQVDGAIVFALHGELDLGSVATLEEALSGFESYGSPRLVIDLEDLQFMDSTGLALLVRAQQTAHENGYRLVCRRGTKQVQRLFELTGVIDRLEFED